jgi:cyclopropane fatty-acyl-phospholipid synthase-like methyltransferase
MEQKEWFANWFDSPYYHLLYQNRDEEEASHFIDNLLNFLQLPKDSHVLDLACGKGRHALMLHQHELKVHGVDLSPNSIEHARKYQQDGLTFSVHDMRQPVPGEHFNAVFNLFTSFGYFDHSNENEQVMKAVHQVLKPHGLFVIDFMNAQRVAGKLISEEHKQIDGVEFQLHRRFDGKHIYKEVQITDGDVRLSFQERVQFLVLEDFKRLLNGSGFVLKEVLGDYALAPFDIAHSDRLILIAQKAE